MFTVIDDAFNEWPGRSPSTFGDWSASVMHRDDAQAMVVPGARRW